jgi:hypothetical protein
LETLEDRITPSAAVDPPAAPPSVLQASLSLYLDGALIVVGNAALDALHQFQAQAHNPDLLPDDTDPQAQAIEELELTLEEFRPPVVVQADIAANLPHAGPFGLFAFISGADSAARVIQQIKQQYPSDTTTAGGSN